MILRSYQGFSTTSTYNGGGKFISLYFWLMFYTVQLVGVGIFDLENSSQVPGISSQFVPMQDHVDQLNIENVKFVGPARMQLTWLQPRVKSLPSIPEFLQLLDTFIYGEESNDILDPSYLRRILSLLPLGLYIGSLYDVCTVEICEPCLPSQ